MEKLASLSPQPLWNLFEELSRIPRPSKHEERAVQWLLEKGRTLGCEVLLRPLVGETQIGNVLFRKPATPGSEARPGVALQAHIDMVCEKSSASPHRFDTDPIQLQIRGDHLYATDTTLGSDNGIGVAAALAVLASRDIAHGPLEVLITVDEETGLTGASQLEPGLLQSQYLLNLDSEEEGILTIGCAGGVDTLCTGALASQPVAADWLPLTIAVRGLKGGHSGMEINCGRGNAIRLLAQTLAALSPEITFSLANMEGGNLRNAIAREATALLWAPPSQIPVIHTAVQQAETYWRSAFAGREPELSIKASPALSTADASTPLRAAFDDKGTVTLLNLVLALPHGVAAMSPEVPGLVETSTNLARLQAAEGAASLHFLTRGSITPFRDELRQRIEATCALAGYQTRHENTYPGWKPSPDNALVRKFSEIYQHTFGEPLKIAAVHAGLECGLIGEKYPEMQMVSFGPNIWNPHSPQEHVSIASVAHFWKLLVAALESL